MTQIITSFFTAGEPFFGVWFVITFILLGSAIILLYVSLKMYWIMQDEFMDFHMAYHKKKK